MDTDVFLLGAGFSKAVSTKMPNLRELSKRLRKAIEVQNLKVPDYVLALGENVEYWMTYLSESHPWVAEDGNLQHKALFLQLTRMLDIELNGLECQVIESDCPYWLINLVNFWHRRRSSVITLNYDTLIERATYRYCTDSPLLKSLYPVRMPDIRRVSVFENPGADTFSLFKLHGSLNFYYSGASSYFGETIYSGTVAPWGFDRQEELESREAASDKVPLIVPPTFLKGTYFQHETIRHIWGQAGASLLSASRIFCIGYSLPETDLSMRFFLQSHQMDGHKTPFFLVNTNLKAPDHFRELLGAQYDIFDTYVTTDDPVAKLVDELQAG